MKKVKLNRFDKRYFSFVIVFFLLGGCVSDDKNDYLDTSNVSYKGRTIKLLATEYIGNPYLKYYKIKISMNIPLNQRLTFRDSALIKNYVDSIFLSLKIKERSTIHFFVFNETNYTNKCFLEEKGLLLCDFSPCIFSYGYIYDPTDSVVVVDSGPIERIEVTSSNCP